MKKQFVTTSSILLTLLNIPITLQARRMSYKKVTTSAEQPYDYTGQEKERELKNKKVIYNYRARTYDPKLKRFFSPDKAKQQWGTYTYVASNPVSLVDATGQWFNVVASAEHPKFYELTWKVIHYLRENGTEESKAMINELFSSKKKISIVYDVDPEFKAPRKFIFWRKRTIYFDPFVDCFLLYLKEPDYLYYDSPLLAFLHEAKHAHESFNIKQFEADKKKYPKDHEDYKWQNEAERKAVFLENETNAFLQSNTSNVSELIASFPKKNSIQGTVLLENEMSLVDMKEGELWTIGCVQNIKKTTLNIFEDAYETMEDRLRNNKLQFNIRQVYKILKDPRVVGSLAVVARIENNGNLYFPKIEKINQPVPKEFYQIQQQKGNSLELDQVKLSDLKQNHVLPGLQKEKSNQNKKKKKKSCFG